jgi:hypothetical protein
VSSLRYWLCWRLRLLLRSGLQLSGESGQDRHLGSPDKVKQLKHRGSSYGARGGSGRTARCTGLRCLRGDIFESSMGGSCADDEAGVTAVTLAWGWLARVCGVEALVTVVVEVAVEVTGVSLGGDRILGGTERVGFAALRGDRCIWLANEKARCCCGC